MVRHYCDHTEEHLICCAESRGEDIDCDNCSCNKDNSKKMKKYWKIKAIEDMLKVSPKEENWTVTMSWASMQRDRIKLLEQAYSDGWNDATKPSEDEE